MFWINSSTALIITGMDFLEVVFPVSGVKTNVLVPPLVAMSISFFSSMGGVSGAFLILPFQMSVLGYVSPSVSATNFVYNIVGIPGGVASYIREGRMNWSLAWVIIAGTLPGVFIGYYLRVRYFPDPARFKVFVGCVLLYIGLRLLRDIIKKRSQGDSAKVRKTNASPIEPVSIRLGKITFAFMGEHYSVSNAPLFILALAVGVIGGTYGIGGGAIIAPFLVTVFQLPVYAVAGAALMGTLITSVAGVSFYSLMPSAHSTSPDWLLGLLFGAGGLAGMYLGARAQKRVPQVLIKLMLCVILLSLSLKYILGVMR